MTVVPVCATFIQTAAVSVPVTEPARLRRCSQPETMLRHIFCHLEKQLYDLSYLPVHFPSFAVRYLQLKCGANFQGLVVAMPRRKAGCARCGPSSTSGLNCLTLNIRLTLPHICHDRNTSINDQTPSHHGMLKGK